MMIAKDLKEILKGIPDNAVVTIDGNYYANIEGVSMEFSDHVTADLKLTKGFSVTCDEVIDKMFDDLRRLY